MLDFAQCETQSLANSNEAHPLKVAFRIAPVSGNSSRRRLQQTFTLVKAQRLNIKSLSVNSRGLSPADQGCG